MIKKFFICSLFLLTLASCCGEGEPVGLQFIFKGIPNQNYVIIEGIRNRQLVGRDTARFYDYDLKTQPKSIAISILALI